VRLCRKLTVEIFVTADPNPDPKVFADPLCYGAVVPRYAYGPKAGVGAQAFKSQRGVGGVLTKFIIGRTRGIFSRGRKLAIGLPEAGCSPRIHDGRPNASSCISGKALGSAFNRASISSPKAVSAGRARGSQTIWSQAASPFNSGKIPGKSATSFSRS
jgi:hypothetical protein